jgi:antitoxin component YwqK of YwqJK toxin-antitoxin module
MKRSPLIVLTVIGLGGCSSATKHSVGTAPKATPTPAPAAAPADIFRVRFEGVKVLFERAGAPPDSIRPRRFVDVGYLRTNAGRQVRQLVVLEVRQSSNFHKKIHFPNRVCATAVRPDNASEAAATRKAIEVLEAGGIPVGNAAYDWAKTYQFARKFCFTNAVKQPARNGVKRFEWELRATPDTMVFRATGWEDRGVILFSAARRSKPKKNRLSEDRKSQKPVAEQGKATEFPALKCPKGATLGPAAQRANGRSTRFEQYCRRRDGVRHGPRILWARPGQKLEEDGFLNGKPHGLKRRWSKSGQKLYEGEYERGIKVGRGTQWLKNGKKYIQSEYKAGLLHGTATLWDKKGNKTSETEYRKGVRHGKVLRWLSTKKVGEGSYKAGKKHGIWVDYWLTGQMRAERVYRNGIEHGPATSWYANGQLASQGQSKNGAPDGSITVWHENGTKLAQGEYAGGELVTALRCWSEAGKKQPCPAALIRRLTPRQRKSGEPKR